MKHLYILIFLVCSNIAQAQIYTLKSCLDEGLKNNYSIQISRNNEEIARNKATRANAGYLPTLDLSAGYGGSLDNRSTSTLRATNETAKTTGALTQNIDAALRLNWTIFDGFSINTNYKRLKELEAIGETNTRITIEDFVAALAAEYYNNVQQKIRLKNFRYAMSLSKERLRIVETRYSIGNMSRLDLQQANVDFNADSSQFVKQHESLNTSRININELMACADINRHFLVVDSVINVNKNLVYNDLLESMLQVNSELLRSEKNLTLAELDLKTVNSRNYPYVKLNSGYGYTYNKYNKGTYTKRDNLGLTFGVTVGINILDGTRKNQRKNANLAIQNARLQRSQLEQSLRADLSNLWQAYQNNIDIINLERQNLIVSKDYYDIAMERYMLGTLSGIEMREAEKNLLDAEERVLSAEYNAKICEISLLQISGKVLKYLE